MKSNNLFLFSLIIFNCFFATAENQKVTCDKLKSTDLKIMTVTNQKRKYEEYISVGLQDKKHQKEAIAYPEAHTKLCLVVKCILKRDNIIYADFKNKLIVEIDYPPLTKSILSSSMDELDLENCSK
jgi:hypothetical protein